jgi:hypothetical protein
MIDLDNMTVRDLIAALAEAEDATRRARSTTKPRAADDRWLAILVAREDLLVTEIRRRTESRLTHPV